MPESRRAVILLILLFGAFSLGVARLIQERYSLGDIHPPYSTLRADPLGAKALHDALAEIGTLAVDRNTTPLSHLDAGRGTTLLVLGLPGVRIAHMDPGLVSALEAAVIRGARVVVSFAPDEPAWATDGGRKERDGEGPERSGPAEADGEGAEEPAKRVEGPSDPDQPALPRTMGERWGFETVSLVLPTGGAGMATATVGVEVGPPLPERISWHAPLCFAGLKDAWRVLYAREGHPVLIERALGAGTLILSSDSFFASNEAVYREPLAVLWSYLVGPARRVVFDETHHGVEDHPSLALLARRYRLQGCLLVLLVLAGLFVWRANSPFVPPEREDPAEVDPVLGRESSAALVDLLRRGVPPRRVVEVCRDVWMLTFRRRRPDLASALEGAAPDPRDPVATYRALQRIVVQMGGDHEL